MVHETTYIPYVTSYSVYKFAIVVCRSFFVRLIVFDLMPINDPYRSSRLIRLTFDCVTFPPF